MIKIALIAHSIVSSWEADDDVRFGSNPDSRSDTLSIRLSPGFYSYVVTATAFLAHSAS